MAQQRNPLSYQCRLIVLQHMGPNHRYFLVSRAPSLRLMHTLVPLKVSHLVLNTYCFTADTITHAFHTFIVNTDNIPENYGIVVPDEGFTYDIDSLGYANVEHACQGDVTIQRWFVNWQVLHEPQRIRQQELDENQPEDVERRLLHHQLFAAERNEDRGKRERGFFRARTIVKYRISTSKASRVVAYPPRFKLAGVLRQLMANFFAASKVSVRVLEVPIPFGVIRLPRCMKFHAQRLVTNVCSKDVVNAMQRVLADPIRDLEVTVRKADDPIFRHEILKTLDVLTLRVETEEEWANSFIVIPTRDIRIVNYSVSQQELVILGKHWITHPRPLGAKVSFGLHNVGERLDKLCRLLRVTTTGVLTNRSCAPEYPHCGTHQLDLNRELNVYVQKVETARETEQRWVLVFEVMDVGSAIGN